MADARKTEPASVTWLLFVVAFLGLSASGYAACPPAPVGKASDSVAQFVTSGTAGFGPTTALDATRSGSVVFDDVAKELKVCNGTNWVSLSDTGTTSMAPGWPDAVICQHVGATTIFYATDMPGSGGLYGYTAGWSNGNTYYIYFNPDGSRNTSSPTLTNCASMSAIKTDGRAFNLLGGGGTPTGAIMAFDATVCPTGWTEYTAARGRFLRGIDNGAGNDPDGTRAPGTLQGDELKSHTHAHDTWNAGIVSGGSGGLAGGSGVNYSYGKSTAAAGGAETRPKNVAVLFCRKN